MSMIGQAGGQNILDKVKRSISDYIDQVEDGDRVTFVTFDVDTRIYPTVLVDDENDRDILKKYITMTEATGLWTYTYKMIIEGPGDRGEAGKGKRRPADRDRDHDRRDRRSASRGQRNSTFMDLAKKYGKKSNWWIYVLSFTQPEKSEAVKQHWSKDLGLISDNVKIIQTGEPEKGERGADRG